MNMIRVYVCTVGPRENVFIPYLMVSLQYDTNHMRKQQTGLKQNCLPVHHLAYTLMKLERAHGLSSAQPARCRDDVWRQTLTAEKPSIAGCKYLKLNLIFMNYTRLDHVLYPPNMAAYIRDAGLFIL